MSNPDNNQLLVRCFTYSNKQGIARVLSTDAVVEDSFNIDTKTNAIAVWDTGATCSVIRPEIAKKLGLKKISQTLISTPTDKDRPSNVYLINLILPNKVRITNLQVVEGIPNNCDMLIGMDIITKGDFAVSNYNNCTMFSFRIPSIEHVDFIKIAKNANKIGRNELCPCGSGKKYKRCHGRTN